MRYSRYFIHNLYETPKEAETPSHILLLRGSYICPVAAGVYSLLPLGHRVAEKVKAILRQELNGIGGMELTMPVLNPAELWKKTRRYYDIGEELFRIRDRKQREFVLAMTHEEVVTDIAKQYLRSYRDLPVMLYQIQTKIRDEARPRAGLLRVREFFMKDGYSFHPDFADLDRYYPLIYNAYLRIFARCGLQAVPIEADPGIMGGTGSHEFMLESANGEDRFVRCTHCDYRANTEKAVGLKPAFHDLPSPPPAMEKAPTPEVKTIADLMGFFNVGRGEFLKNCGLRGRWQTGAGRHPGGFCHISEQTGQSSEGGASRPGAGRTVDCARTARRIPVSPSGSRYPHGARYFRRRPHPLHRGRQRTRPALPQCAVRARFQRK